MSVAMTEVAYAAPPLPRSALSLVPPLVPTEATMSLGEAWFADYEMTKTEYVSVIWSAEFNAALRVKGRDPIGALKASWGRVGDGADAATIQATCLEMSGFIGIPARDLWLILTTEEA